MQADMVSAQRFSISSLSDKSVNASLADDGAASIRALAGSMLNYKVIPHYDNHKRIFNFFCYTRQPAATPAVVLQQVKTVCQNGCVSTTMSALSPPTPLTLQAMLRRSASTAVAASEDDALQKRRSPEVIGLMTR